jgi:nucleoid DNA-binding protein
LTQTEVIKALSQRTGIPSTKVRDLMRALGDQVPQWLAEHGDVPLGSLGSFRKYKRPRWKGVGNKIYAARELPKFYPSKPFREYVADRGWTRNKSDAD